MNKKNFPLRALLLLIGLVSIQSHADTSLINGSDIGKTTAVYGVNFSGGEFGSIGSAYGTGYIYPDINDLTYFAGKGMKFGRLPFLWERVQPTLLGPLDPNEVARLHAFLKNAASVGIKVLLDMHNYAQYQLPNGSKPHIGEDPTLTIAAYQDVWRKLALEFKNDVGVMGYDIMNEPEGFANPVGRTWFTAAQAAVNAIRISDTATTIYIEGDCWASAANWSTCNAGLNIIDPSSNFVYSAHQYFDASASGNYDNTTYDNQNVTPTTGVDRVTGFVAWLRANNARGHIGEYGVPNNDARYLVTLQNFLDYLAANCVSGTDWSAGPWWGTYLLSVEPTNGIDAPQMSTLANYTVRTCTNSTYKAPTSGTPTVPALPAAIQLKSSNGYFVSAVNGGGQGLSVDRTVASTWESFGLTDLTSKTLTSGDLLNLTASNKQYFSAECGGGPASNCGMVNANRTAASTWEAFKLIKVGGSTGAAIANGDLVAFQSSGGFDCSADLNGGGVGSTFTCNRTSVQGWETFTISW